MICFYSSHQLTNSLDPKLEGRGFLLVNYSRTSPTWFPKSHLPKGNIYQPQEKKLKKNPTTKNWRIKYVVQKSLPLLRKEDNRRISTRKTSSLKNQVISISCLRSQANNYLLCLSIFCYRTLV